MGRTKNSPSALPGFCALFLFFIYPHAPYAQGLKGVTYTCANDTILSKLDYCTNPSGNKFFSIDDISISTDYTLLDSISLHTNSYNAEILILSPAINDRDGAAAATCRNSKYNKRLFVLLTNAKNKFHVQTINERLILNENDAQSEPYKKIVPDKNGFILQYFIGSINKCSFNFHFAIRGQDIYLVANEYNCYTTDLKTAKKGTRKYNKKISQVDIYKYLPLP